MAKYCSECGSPLKPDDTFCAECGHGKKSRSDSPINYHGRNRFLSAKELAEIEAHNRPRTGLGLPPERLIAFIVLAVVIVWIVVSALPAPKSGRQVAPSSRTLDTQRLTQSPKIAKGETTGLFNVPLPFGTVLLDQVAETTTSDAIEDYSTAHSASQIRSFYRREMPTNGWLTYMTDLPTVLNYKKGNRVIAVVTNERGGKFTLMGGHR